MNQGADRQAGKTGGRIAAVDILRGLVMVLMALDHTRDFFSNIAFDPADLSKTSVGLFLTRWITHFCAPVFIFLAGSSAYLSAVHHPDKRRLSLFLLTRGLWIMFLGIVFESPIWCFTPDFSELSGAVLWVIGWSMIALAGLVFMPLSVIVVFGLVMIGGHNLLDGITQHDLTHYGWIWAVLHTGETIGVGDRSLFHPYYPLIPWIGVMACGYGFGRLLVLEKTLRSKTLFVLGGTMILLFILLRFSNCYGDPHPWSHQATPVFTLLSFINCEKYPPSLLYLLMTLGPAVLLLPLLDGVRNRFGGILETFGRTPLFFYLLHLPLILLLSLVNALVMSEPDVISSSRTFLEGYPQAYGYGLPVVYLVWIGVVALLYPVCRWFDNIKRQDSHRFLKYL